eukprot:234974-Prymnesium_polylepis.1
MGVGTTNWSGRRRAHMEEFAPLISHLSTSLQGKTLLSSWRRQKLTLHCGHPIMNPRQYSHFTGSAPRYRTLVLGAAPLGCKTQLSPQTPPLTPTRRQTTECSQNSHPNDVGSGHMNIYLASSPHFGHSFPIGIHTKVDNPSAPCPVEENQFAMYRKAVSLVQSALMWVL